MHSYLLDRRRRVYLDENKSIQYEPIVAEEMESRDLSEVDSQKAQNKIKVESCGPPSGRRLCTPRPDCTVEREREYG